MCDGRQIKGRTAAGQRQKTKKHRTTCGIDEDRGKTPAHHWGTDARGMTCAGGRGGGGADPLPRSDSGNAEVAAGCPTCNGSAPRSTALSCETVSSGGRCAPCHQEGRVMYVHPPLSSVLRCPRCTPGSIHEYGFTVGPRPRPASRAPSLCPATVSLTASASFNGICNRQ